MILQPLGDSAVRFPLSDDLDRAAAFAALRALPGVVDVVFTEVWGAVRFEGEVPDVAAAITRVREGAFSLDQGPSRPRTHVVRVRYDGPDLARVAAWAGLSRDEVIRRHATAYTVRFIGFLPGFGYLGPVDPTIAAPRHPAPRPRVPAGSVGLAGTRTGIYPSASPGGWNLLGEVVDFVAFDPQCGATLAVGDTVRFEPA